MKTLTEYIRDVAISTALTEAKAPMVASKAQVKEFIEKNFAGAKYEISNRPNKNGYYEVKLSGRYIDFKGYFWQNGYKPASITDDQFVITDINCTTFTIGSDDDRHRIYGIKGLPDKLNCNLRIRYTYINNLEDLPSEVQSLYLEYNHYELVNLTGLNKCNIKDNLYMVGNKITSIAGLPEKINGNFTLDFNSQLDLKGQEQYLPKYVGGNCVITRNGEYAKPKGKQYSEKMIAKLIDVKGKITADR